MNDEEYAIKIMLCHGSICGSGKYVVTATNKNNIKSGK
jgi:hypothetical protein